MSRRVGYSTWFQYSRVHLFYRKITLDFSLVKCRKNINKKIMNHKCDHALKVLLPEQKVKRNHNQTIKTLLLIEDLFSSAGKIGIPVKWIAFWSYVSGVNWEVMNHQWACFPTQTFRVSDACKKAKQALTIQCDSKLEICKKGTKGLHKKMETVMAGCCVEVQCTFSHFKWQRHWFKCYAFNSTKWHARGPNFHALIYLFGFLFFFSIAGHFNHVHCTLCEEKEKMSQILVFNNAVQYLRSCKMYPLYRNLQHVVYQDWMGGTQWHSTDLEKS